ncbi:cilia- and flagella-associated protein 52 [Xiphophorus hellerii]|uniref:cilia- and flagella-associated protein 52 n=1 Tax=Xiphophorus hellerii TaxID=8084 RepID=UPI0013B3FDCA|nr:cilia- and flagella-associated protein 52 [Xiphophorus hellerii]
MGSKTIPLELDALIGFNGQVPFGLKLHPDRKHLIYPLGSIIVLKRIEDGKLEFLDGHSNNVSCISVSKSGSYIASGQVNFMGFQAPVIIWNYAERTIHVELRIHNTKVESVAFSPSEKYLVSLGGKDDCRIFVWNVETKQLICRNKASAQGHCLVVEYSKTDDTIFASAGSLTLRVWKFVNERILPTDCWTNMLKRHVSCIEISEDNRYMYCATSSGDIMKIDVKGKILSICGPGKAKFNHGINVLKLLESGDLLVGSGSGILALCSQINFKPVREIQLENAVTSIAISEGGEQFYVGTEEAQMYRLRFKDFTAELISTGHRSAVKDVALPHATSKLFATCSGEEIRVWMVGKPKDQLRITVPNVTCNAIDFMHDDCSIISAWSDGNIRRFGMKGQLMVVINNAHRQGVTAIAGTKDSKRIISGGGEGKMHVWELLPHTHQILNIMVGHRRPVSCLRMKSDDKECVTVSSDGFCIIWDLVHFHARQKIKTDTLFRTVCYHPDGYQIVTCGTDGKVIYWDVMGGTNIREREDAETGVYNSIHTTQEGSHFVTGGEDKRVKVWDYMQGKITHISMPAGASITCTRICTLNRILVSTSTDGGIWLWKFPHLASSS